MPSMLKISEYLQKSQWIKDSLRSMLASGNIDEGMEMRSVKRIMKTNQASYGFLYEAMGGKKTGSFSFWVTKKTVDQDYWTVSNMVSRKGLNELEDNK